MHLWNPVLVGLANLIRRVTRHLCDSFYGRPGGELLSNERVAKLMAVSLDTRRCEHLAQVSLVVMHDGRILDFLTLLPAIPEKVF